MIALLTLCLVTATSNASCDPVHAHLLLYNRIPKTGSTSLRAHIENLQFVKDYYLVTSRDWLHWHVMNASELAAVNREACKYYDNDDGGGGAGEGGEGGEGNGAAVKQKTTPVNPRIIYDKHVRFFVPQCTTKVKQPYGGVR